jgi:hypothetical protein
LGLYYQFGQFVLFDLLRLWDRFDPWGLYYLLRQFDP